jgi:Protein of unknown function (DUF2786)
MDRQILLSRIQNLLNKTVQNGATEAEAATAMANAQRLMDQHNIALADIVSRSDDDSIFEQADAWTSDTAHSHFVSCLPIIEQVFAVKTVLWKTRYQGRRSAYTIKVFGDASNIENATWAINFLGPLYRRLWDRFRAAHKAPTADMLNYYGGLTDGVLRRLQGDRQLEATGSRALVLLNGRLEQAFGAAFPNLKQIVKKNTGSADAYHAGLKDSDQINLARPLDNPDRRSLEGTRRALAAR